MTLSIDIAATFGGFTARASLEVSRGETLVVLGPSGSGKTLLLETIAGFHPHRGTVSLNGRDLTDTPPEDRDFGFVFQDYALFPHMTVHENAAFGGRYRERSRDPDGLLTELGVADLADRYPRTLSGGEAQRVALARALAVSPEVLLLDEPLSSLDVPTRRSLRDDLLGVLDGVTAVYVTHNRTTARILADRIAVMRGGRIVQEGRPDTVFERPASPFVAEFTGGNAIPLDSSVGSALDDVDARATHVAIRPEHVALSGGEADVTATVERVVREDATYRVTLDADGIAFDAYTTTPPGVGETVGVSFPAGHRSVIRGADSSSGG